MHASLLAFKRGEDNYVSDPSNNILTWVQTGYEVAFMLCIRTSLSVPATAPAPATVLSRLASPLKGAGYARRWTPHENNSQI